MGRQRQTVKQHMIVIASRVIKLTANINKMLCYPFHALFPNKRFTLPAYSAPLLRPSSKQVAIPRIIWQTNFTEKVTLPVYLNYLFNRLMAPRFEYRFMVTEARHAFIAAHYDRETTHNYLKLQIGAAQADFWRLLVLQAYGGVYLDIDAHAIWPLSSTLAGNTDELYLVTRRGEFSNYFIASKPQNANLEKLITQINHNINDNQLNHVFQLTGPGVFNQLLNIEEVPTVLYRHACNQGSFTNEYFQYIDKAAGKWNKEQQKVSVIRQEEP